MYIIHEDLILADWGFDILALRGTALVISLFTKGVSQLSEKEVEISRNVRTEFM